MNEKIKNNEKKDWKTLPYMNQSMDLETRVDDLLARLTFKEKCLLCAGEKDNAPPGIERLGIPPFGMTDGPHGVSPYKTGLAPGGVRIKIQGDGTATYFPTGIQLASTWNPDLLQEFGAALAEETRAVGRYMQLGPAMNICRNPMNGRTFEYFSEDPLLSGALGAAVVKGLQSKRIAPCIKHYVANNFETNRFKVNVVVSKRALEEIYLAGFKKCVLESDPWGLMSSYNKVNGTYVSEHEDLLKKTLKESWGFSGVVVSDWGATNHTTGMVALIKAGMDIEMGSRNKYNIEEMINLKESGEFPEKEFDDNIRRFLRVMFRVGIFDDPATVPEGKINTKEHQAIAKKLAEEGMILLKNENQTLPLDKKKVKKIAILGKHADLKFGRKKLGGGSSAVYPPYEITIREGLTKKCQEEMKDVEFVEDPGEADVAIVCIGLEHTHDFKGGDHEGSDRLRYELGYKQTKLVNSTAKKNKNTIVVCVNGAPFGIEKFIDNVPAVLEAWYGGMEIGTVVADVLFGDVNPSGKLPVSWPRTKKDIPTAFSLLQTIVGVKEVIYEEDVFVGYRYYEKNNVNLRFCFGHGLSYTNFEYSDLKLNSKKIKSGENIKVSCKIKNAGKVPGAEIVQLYIHDLEASVPRPIKELKGFKKVFLKPAEEVLVEFDISEHDLSFYSEEKDDWIAEPGEFEILIGSSIKDIKLSDTFQKV
ncbi:MAG: glycoside hydrolase family 3 C-terminal domain-containing protein [Promethearchaeota archaeon]